jgi:hypothetical protein
MARLLELPIGRWPVGRLAPVQAAEPITALSHASWRQWRRQLGLLLDSLVGLWTSSQPQAALRRRPTAKHIYHISLQPSFDALQAQKQSAQLDSMGPPPARGGNVMCSVAATDATRIAKYGSGYLLPPRTVLTSPLAGAKPSWPASPLLLYG